MRRLLKIAGFIFTLILIGFVIRIVYLQEKTDKIEIIFTNDIHGHIFSELEDTGKSRGGFPALSTFLKKVKNPYILLDAGDIFQGTPEGNFSKGKVVIDAMNYLGYDACTMGNHEIDFGMDVFKKLVERSRFPFLCANFIEEKTGSVPDFLKPYVILKVGKYKIGVIGIITSLLPEIVIKENIKGYTVIDEIEVLKKYINELKDEVDILIILSHVGISRDKKYLDDVEIAKNVKGIDFIIGGHTHQFLEFPLKVNDTYIFQAGCFLKSVGRIVLRIHKEKKKIIDLKYKLIPLYLDYFPEDKNLFDLLKSSLGDIYTGFNVKIGESKRWLYRFLRGKQKKNGELPLGNLITDVMRKYAKTDFAFQNIGGIRADLPKGDIKLRHIYMLHPFGNTIYTMKLTGKKVRKLLEQSVSGKFGILQVSGLKLIWDSYLPEGRRVLNVIVNGKEIEEDKEYTVATNSFLAQGGDGFTVFLEGKDVKDTGVLLRDVMIEYIKDNSSIDAKVEGRIVNVSIE
ncbi:MAG: hypothetical protein DRI36_02705 [Caldiserica bacterium]|nr:MAG: hypothetical protein DRI36_02705 [Caldisericota bacterium]